MNIVLTNDDGFAATGLRAAFRALQGLGNVHVVAPKRQQSACGHAITLGRGITAERVRDDLFDEAYTVDGTPADCVRLAVHELAEGAVDLVVAGINHGANAGADVYYSGTVAAAREGALLGLPAIAVSQALRKGVETDWLATEAAARDLIASLAGEKTPAAGFWSVNLPAPLPSEPDRNVHRVGIAAHPIPLVFERDDGDGTAFSFTYGASYWQRDVTGPSDFSTIRDGGIAVTAIPLFGRF